MILSCLDDDIYLSMLNLAGTHDSATAYVSMEKMSRCQSLTVKEQLCKGIRLFDIRLNRKGGDFFLVHSLADCFTDESRSERLSFDSVLELLYGFLRENPREILVVSIKQDRGIQSRRFFTAFFEKYIKNNEDKWYLANENPVLGQCRGKIVLMRRCKRQRHYRNNDNCGLDFSQWEDQDSKKKFHPELLVLKEGLTALIQDRYGLNCSDKWDNSAKPFLDCCETAKDKFAIHFISTAYREKGADLKKGADEINEKFTAYPLRQNTGWILVDFADKEICDKIMLSNVEVTE